MTNTKNGTKLTKALMLGTALVALSSEQLDAATFTDVGLMSAQILTPIVVTNPTPLVFGNMTVGTTAGGTMAIDTLGAQTPGGTVVAVATPLTASQGVLNLTAEPARAVVVTVVGQNGGGASDLVALVPTPTITMSVTGFDLNATGVRTDTVTLPGGGTMTLPVGATLNVATSQATGLYTGAYTVTANYM